MAILESKGLRGLPGLNNLSEQERQAFMDANASVLNTYRSPRARQRAAEAMYNNQQFINRFGQEAFDSMRGGAEDRDALLKETLVDDAYKEAYSPFEDKANSKGKRDNNKGLGKDFEKYYNDLSTDAKLKMLQSDWKTPEQMKKQQGDYTGVDFLDKAIDFVAGEAIDQHRKEANDKILQKIYNDDADTKSKNPKIATAISQVYMNQDVTGHNNEETKKLFYDAITPSKTNYGISEYASHYGDGSEDQVTSEMEDFSIDDMRQVLAKKYVYGRTMSPEMASTALNNEAKRYIKTHQGSAKRFLLFANDVGISALSYTADKINGIYNLGLAAADKLSDWGANSEKPIVYVDDQGNVLDPNMKGLSKDGNGIFYMDEEGKRHSVHQEQIDRTTLHNMGRNLDGSEDTSILNAQYWTKAEQFGTLDEDEQKQYEKLGSSPYKVAYNPNEDSDLWYESFKMMSFGIADAASMLIPFGVGVAGRVLSTASKAGKVTKGLGKAMDTAGKYLSAQTRIGQVIQGGAGAAGIAYAYNRGAFQETLAQNLANAEEANLNRSKQEVYDRYQNNEAYKAEVDAAIANRAAELKATDVNRSIAEGGSYINSPERDAQYRQIAQEQVLGEMVQQNAEARKGTQEYAALQQEAINSAGDAAVRTFLPEAIKYGLVNTIGFRKFLYTNPAGLKKSVSAAFKGMEEKVAADGTMRMTAGATKFGTVGAKAKQLGKIAASQMWGGAWTNGTDDMMVDAAERINEDSFKRYTDAYQKGEAVADTYGFIDGLYSYWKGLQNSLGQESTYNATAVGGFGSLVSASPNMANIAHLASKEGRDAYRNNFMKRPVYETGEDGIRRIKRDEQGNPVMEDVALSENWRERANFFIQNGVLNNYYGKKQSERELQNHADYVNDILDRYDDFRAITDMVNSDISRDNADNIKDKKTANFVHAIEFMNVLDHLGRDKSDPTTMSSVVQGMKDFITKADAYNKGNQEAFSQEEIGQMLKEYSAVNPQFDVEAEGNAEAAFSQIMQNAKKLQEASNAYNKAEEEVQKVEKTLGYKISPTVRENLKLNKALQGHWQERVDTMRDEIEDTSDINSETEGATLLATYGGKKKTEKEIAASEKIDVIYNGILNESVAKTQRALDKYNKAQEALKVATTSDEIYKAQEAVKTTKAEYESTLAEKQLVEDDIAANKEKKVKLEKALKEQTEEWRVLRADEIKSLNPIDRARMLNPENRSNFNKKQIAQIEKLEADLGVDGVQKVQDIASLSRRIAQNKDAYRRISNNPDAAAIEFERQEAEAAKRAYDIIAKRNARTLAEVVTEAEEGLQNRDGITQDVIDDTVYRMLRRHNSNMLDTIEEEKLIPQYAKQINDAKEWGQITSDIDAVISEADSSNEWKANISRNISQVIDNANSKESVIAALEKVIDDTDNTQAAADAETVLQGLEKLGYQRDATVIEKREKRRARQAQEKVAKEAAAKKSQEDAQAEAAKKAAEEQEKKWVDESKQKNTVNADGSNLQSPWDVAPIDQSEETAEQKGELSEPIDITEEDRTGSKKQQKEESAVNNDMESNIVDNGDTVQGKSSTIEEQATVEGQKEQHTSDEITDVATINGTGEHIIDNSATTLSGNAMSEYQSEPLQNEGKLEHKKGESPNDSMSKFYAWMDAAGIKLQNIIDTELAEILRRNPQAKVKFMVVRPQSNATNDGDMKRHLMLVLDFDSSINKNIASIHNDENGGVLESNGKKYLVIGVVGYGNKNSDKLALYDILFSNNPNKGNGYGLVRRGMGEFFRNNPNERFYVPEELSTEIVAGSLIPGYIVKQLEGEDNAQYRSVTELLNDQQRNPLGLDIQSLAWGIQEKTKFLVVGTSLDRVMVPRNVEGNLGSAFVLVPAANGKMVPSYLKPLFYNEMNDGKLKDRINDLLMNVVSPNYATRLAAVNELSKIFYFGKDGDNILLGKDGSRHSNEVSLKRGEDTIKTFVLNSDFDRQQFMEAFADMNPRINITASVLQSPVMLQQYDEAGALQTDIARLATAGSSYSIYGVDAQGNMVKPDVVNNDIPRDAANTEFRNGDKTQVIYNHNFYQYDATTDQYLLNGEVVQDANTLKQLDYNRRIIESGLIPVQTEGIWKYYILGSEEHPEVVKVNKNTYDVQDVKDKQAKDLVDKVAKERADREREEAAKQEVDKLDNMQREAIEKGEANLSEEWVVDPETGELIAESKLREKEKKEEEGEVSVGQQSPNQKEVASRSGAKSQVGTQGNTQTLNDLVKSKAYRVRVITTIKNKWPQAPTKITELEQFLRDKNIEVDAIGTSEADVQAWIKTLEDCR